MSGDAIGLHSPVATDANAGGVVAIDTKQATSLGLDINVSAFVGGTAPTITFFLDRIDAYGQAYQVWTSGALAATGKISANISPNTPTAAQNAELGPTCQLRWAFGGTANPTSVTWSATAYAQR